MVVGLAARAPPDDLGALCRIFDVVSLQYRLSDSSRSTAAMASS
jgi:hypothetical protein